MGISWLPDALLPASVSECGDLHDIAYTRGGTWKDKLQADKEFAANLAKRRNFFSLAIYPAIVVSCGWLNFEYRKRRLTDAELESELIRRSWNPKYARLLRIFREQRTLNAARETYRNAKNGEFITLRQTAESLIKRPTTDAEARELWSDFKAAKGSHYSRARMALSKFMGGKENEEARNHSADVSNMVRNAGRLHAQSDADQRDFTD